MYQMVDHNGGKAYKVDNKLYQTQLEAKADMKLQMQRAKIELEIVRLQQEQDALFRKEVGLTLLESDANVIKAKRNEALIELAFYREMGKNEYVITEAGRKVANTQLMYESVCKKIFKVCLKHGLKSEHLK